jgi:hypothetical protein
MFEQWCQQVIASNTPTLSRHTNAAGHIVGYNLKYYADHMLKHPKDWTMASTGL